MNEQLVEEYKNFLHNGKTERECAEEIIGSTAKTRPMKLIFAIVGGVAVLSGAYMLYRNSHKNSTQKMDKVA